MTHTSNPMAAIAAELAGIKNRNGIALDTRNMPATRALMDDAKAAIGRAIPARFDHCGKTFYLRLCIGMAHLEVFEHVASPEPLCASIQGSYETYGHAPAGA